VSIRAVVLIRDVARSIVSARFFGSVTVGLCTRERQSMVPRPFRDTADLEEIVRLAAITSSSYRDHHRLISANAVGLRPPRFCALIASSRPRSDLVDPHGDAHRLSAPARTWLAVCGGMWRYVAVCGGAWRCMAVWRVRSPRVAVALIGTDWH
jgi:hypothetical protein